MITIGSNTEVENPELLDKSGDLIIGNDCHISKDVIIYTHHHGEGNEPWRPEMDSVEIPTKIVIGNNVFIGRRSFITSSCHKIGNCSTVGAQSVVTHDIGEKEIWAGSPARLIKKYE